LDAKSAKAMDADLPIIQISLIELGPFRTKAIQNMVVPPVHPAYTDPTLAAHGLRKRLEQPEKIDGDADKATAIIYKVDLTIVFLRVLTLMSST
jgi:hypothetical protein